MPSQLIRCPPENFLDIKIDSLKLVSIWVLNYTILSTNTVQYIKNSKINTIHGFIVMSYGKHKPKTYLAIEKSQQRQKRRERQNNRLK